MLRISHISLLVLGSLLLLAGCGGSDTKASKTSTVSSSASKSHTPNADIRGNDAGPHAGQAEGKLKVGLAHVSGSVSASPDMACTTKASDNTCSVTVTCPADSTDKEAAALCTWLAGSGRVALTEKPAANQVCTEQYGGPEVATVTGTIDGTKVDARFSRVDGCQIARFGAAQRLWGGDGASRMDDPEVISDPPEAFH